MSYQSFLIAPFATGLDTDQSPWLLPQDAFSDIVNGHIHHGVIEKREGFAKQGDIVHQDQTNWKITGVTKADPGVVSVTSATGISNGDIVEIRNVVGMTELNNNQYTVANVGATSFELENTDTTDFSTWGSVGDVYVVPQDRVMGIDVYLDSGNGRDVVAFNTLRASKLNTTTGVFDPLDSADIMDGSDTDFIWSANWASTASTAASTLYRLYFTNGKALAGGLNGIRYYDGGTTTLPFNPTINAGVTINGSKLLFAYNQRLVILHTFEGSETYPQRARWSQAQKPGNSGAFTDEWDDNIPGKGGFVDAPTGDHIISAKFVQDYLIVFFTNSVWALKATRDPALPFSWVKINNFRGCDGKMSTEEFDRYAVAASVRGITATDGVKTERIDKRIEDFVTEEINDAQFEKVFSKRSFANRRMWMLYAGGSAEATDNDAALIFNEESRAFSKYDIGMNVLGEGSVSLDSTIDDFGDKTIYEFADETIRSYFFDDISDILLGGNVTGEIFRMEEGGTDNSEIFYSGIIDVTQADPAVVTMDEDIGIVNGAIVSISGIGAGSMVELNDRKFTVGSKSGNEFALVGVDSSAYTAYDPAQDRGTIGRTMGDSISFELTSAAWNPWMTEGKQSQLGYVDLFIETHPSARMEIEFFTNNGNTSYAVKAINLLPNLVERAAVTSITNANPGQVVAASHGLLDGEQIYIYGVEGMVGVNGGPYTVTVIDSDCFTIGVDTTDSGEYTNFGVITELEYASTKAWKRVYAGGTGYQHVIKITSSGRDVPIKIHAFMPWFKPRGRVI